ncbi:CLUMA_CG003786, isoform A [Clunio marinus]|uniref:CLUMA_CG003786, isoform A n=1 Tax=Clunio marinus TaxID=568069 RepID=A0A1J1HQ14_9DIPT|nr:CLUMA_CG003786, isoform A [Clunio marinus]
MTVNKKREKEEPNEANLTNTIVFPTRQQRYENSSQTKLFNKYFNQSFMLTLTCLKLAYSIVRKKCKTEKKVNRLFDIKRIVNIVIKTT